MFKLDNIDKNQLESFCQRHKIRKLSVFGSALRPDFNEQSDLDILVEFETDAVPGFLGLARLQGQLADLLGYDKIDLRTPEDLSSQFRQQVLELAEVQYVS